MKPERRTIILTMLGLWVLALGLRLAGLGKESLWFDEFCAFQAAAQPNLGAVFQRVRIQETGPPLYFLLVHYFMKLAGQGDWALRLPSALAGSLAPPLLYLLALALRPGRRGEALLAGGLLTLSPMHLWYSQEARAYALLVMLEVAGLAALALACRRALAAGCASLSAPGSAKETDALGMATHGAGSGRLLLAVALLVAALYVHNFAFFFAAGGAAALLWANFSAEPGRRLFPAGTLAAALLIALAGAADPFVEALDQFSGSPHLAWLPDHYGPSVLFDVARAQWLGPHWSPLPYGVQLAGIGVGLALALLGGWGAWRRRAEDPLPIILLASGVFFTLVLPVAISFVKPIIYYGQRYLIIAVPFTVLAVAWGVGVGDRRGRALSWGLLGFLVILQGIYLGNHFAYRAKHTWDTLGERLEKMARPGDAVFVLPERAAGLLGRYMPAGSKIAGLTDYALIRNYLKSAAGQAFVVSYSDPRRGLESARFAGPFRAVLFETHRPGQNLWLVEISSPLTKIKRPVF